LQLRVGACAIATPAIAAAAAGATVLVGAATMASWVARALAAVVAVLRCCWAHWSKHARRASLSSARLLHCCQPGWLGAVLGAVCA